MLGATKNPPLHVFGMGRLYWQGLEFLARIELRAEPLEGGLIVVSANTERKGEAAESSSMEYLQMVWNIGRVQENNQQSIASDIYINVMNDI